MNKKILFIPFIIHFLFFCKIVTAQFPCQLPDSIYWTNVPGAGMNYTNVEIRIFNQTSYFRTYHNGEEESDSIKVKIFPVGTFFNGYYEYSPSAKVPIQSDSNITGIEITIPLQSSPTSISYKSGNWDASNGNTTE